MKYLMKSLPQFVHWLFKTNFMSCFFRLYHRWWFLKVLKSKYALSHCSHTEWKFQKIVYHKDFSWNQFWGFLKCKISHLWHLEPLHFGILLNFSTYLSQKSWKTHMWAMWKSIFRLQNFQESHKKVWQRRLVLNNQCTNCSKEFLKPFISF